MRDLRAVRLATLIIAALMGAAGGAAPTGAQVPSDALRSFAEEVTQAGRVRLTGAVRCYLGAERGWSQAFTGNDAAGLLRVAMRGRIYLFVHGFYPNPDRATPPMSYAESTWAGHLQAVRSVRPDSAACLFALNTGAGFGPHQDVLGRFLFALRALTDDSELFDPGREIRLVSYSAGVNFAKDALLRFQQLLGENGRPRDGLYDDRVTPMRISFLGGVHTGTAVSSMVSSAVALADLLTALDSGPLTPDGVNPERRAEEQRRRTDRAEVTLLLRSRGANQLGDGSQVLRQLNRAFADALGPSITVQNFVGEADAIAPAASARLSFVPSVMVPGFTHSDFVRGLDGAAGRSLLRVLYGT